LHANQYGYANPVSNTDPSGRITEPPEPRDLPCIPFDFTDPDNPATCRYPPPITPPAPIQPTPTQASPIQCVTSATTIEVPRKPPARPGPEDIGYIEGVNLTASAFGSAFIGTETVFNLYDFEIGVFSFVNDIAFANDVSISAGTYVGIVTGWSKYSGGFRGVKNYAGGATFGGGSVTIPFVKGPSVGGLTFFSDDTNLRGTTVGIGVGVGLPGNPLPGAATFGHATYTPLSEQKYRMGSLPRYVDALRFVAAIAGIPGGFQPGRAWAMQKALANGYAWEKYAGPK
jgi:hypothetical protein